jgi:hypothetical protein
MSTLINILPRTGQLEPHVVSIENKLNSAYHLCLTARCRIYIGLTIDPTFINSEDTGINRVFAETLETQYFTFRIPKSRSPTV